MSVAEETEVADFWMVPHAAARGAVRTPGGVGTLIGWPSTTATRATVVVSGRHLHPLKSEVTPIVCGVCWQPADPTLAAGGIKLCRSCATDEATANV